MPLLQMFDKQVTLRMGQANVRRWVDDIMPLVTDDGDPLGVEGFATHHLPLDDASRALRDLPEEGRRRLQGPAASPDKGGGTSPARLVEQHRIR